MKSFNVEVNVIENGEYFGKTWRILALKLFFKTFYDI